MATWMVWTIAIPLIVSAFSLVMIMIGLLVALGRTVSILRDIEDKLHSLNPLARFVHRIGDKMDEGTEGWGERSCPGRDLVDLLMWGFSKFKKWRKG